MVFQNHQRFGGWGAFSKDFIKDYWFSGVEMTRTGRALKNRTGVGGPILYYEMKVLGVFTVPLIVHHVSLSFALSTPARYLGISKNPYFRFISAPYGNPAFL